MGCITLLSDFGVTDPTVASVKGMILSAFPGATLVDISHMSEPFQLQQGAYFLASTHHHFPAGTTHLILQHIFYHPEPQLVLAQKNGQYFLAPDNGLLSLAFEDALEKSWLCPSKKTVTHLSDWMAHALSILTLLMEKPPEQLNLPEQPLEKKTMAIRPRINQDSIECHVLHVDRYENVILNLRKDEFEAVRRGRAFRIRFSRTESLTRLSKSYHDVRFGERLCRFNQAGYLEIAIHQGRAAGLFGLEMFYEKSLIYNTVKIEFE